VPIDAAEASSSRLPLMPPMTVPENTAPGSTISRLPPPLKLTAVPPLPLIVPALVSVLPAYNDTRCRQCRCLGSFRY